MSERKVLNKYIPPDFDPRKIPKREAPKPQHTVRLMAPFSMRCNSCGEFIYKGRKFNARKETVPDENYLGIKIYRFYIRCPTCAAEITYRTDPQRADYRCESGAKRNFEPWREEKEEEERAKTRRLLEEIHNPMRASENKTWDSVRELEITEALDSIRQLKGRMEQVDVDEVFDRLGEAEFSLQPGIDLEIDKGTEEEDREKAEEDAAVRQAFERAHKQQFTEPTIIPRVSAKDLLLDSSHNLTVSTKMSLEMKRKALGLGITRRDKKDG